MFEYPEDVEEQSTLSSECLSSQGVLVDSGRKEMKGGKEGENGKTKGV